LIAIIYVGGAGNDILKNHFNDLIMDGLNAVRNSLKFGIIPGGGVPLLNASQLIDHLELEDLDEYLGA